MIFLYILVIFLNIFLDTQYVYLDKGGKPNN